MKPILFNTEMVRAILDGRKTVTRIVVSQKLLDKYDEYNDYVNAVAPAGSTRDFEKTFFMKFSPHSIGDILYVREAWARLDCSCCEGDYKGECFNIPADGNGCNLYQASHEISGDLRWRPSIHMPKEVARIFLRVTGVRVERLQEITADGAEKEGFTRHVYPQDFFAETWSEIYDPLGCGWNANPWVLVIEFERCEKPQENL